MDGRFALWSDRTAVYLNRHTFRNWYHELWTPWSLPLLINT